MTQFVKMLELPYFSYVRIDLLDVSRNSDLYRALQSVLMVIPQGKTFELLKNRLNCVAFFAHMDQAKMNINQPSHLEENLQQIYLQHQEGKNQLN